MSSNLIILRGNSGSGKTTIAKLMQKELGGSAMLVSQDVVRREILHVSDEVGNPAIELIYELCMYGNKIGRTVILEGILSKNKYGTMLQKLINDFDGDKSVYYFDIPFEETVRRHASKLESHEFGKRQLAEWWQDKDYLEVDNEHIVDQSMTPEQIVNLIKNS